ncbi:hypothetical protein DPEC_G00260020 [Dallia pectoralis]|uniref:Uncharacterized protein n=1 Tax=Dallia pectoralis TaxID=75939 RepID=A0ACC2FR46_DALPE|nr:hypothetical protein DPEC_G00260020 [Dallia pectoralis]
MAHVHEITAGDTAPFMHHQMPLNPKSAWPSNYNSENNNLNWSTAMDASQYPGYTSNYWYPQSHSTAGHYENAYPSGSDGQPPYNPQAMQAYPNGHSVYNPGPGHIQARAAQDQSRAQGGQQIHMLSTSIHNTTILDLTVKGLQAIFLGLTHIMGKVVLRYPQTLHTPPDNPFTLGPRLSLGFTQVVMDPLSSSGSRAANLHTATTEHLYGPNNHQPGQGLALEPRHPMKPRTSNTQDPTTNSMPHRWYQNPEQPSPQTPVMASL